MWDPELIQIKWTVQIERVPIRFYFFVCGVGLARVRLFASFVGCVQASAANQINLSKSLIKVKGCSDYSVMAVNAGFQIKKKKRRKEPDVHDGKLITTDESCKLLTRSFFPLPLPTFPHLPPCQVGGWYHRSTRQLRRRRRWRKSAMLRHLFCLNWRFEREREILGPVSFSATFNRFVRDPLARFQSGFCRDSPRIVSRRILKEGSSMGRDHQREPHPTNSGLTKFISSPTWQDLHQKDGAWHSGHFIRFDYEIQSSWLTSSYSSRWRTLPSPPPTPPPTQS